MIRAEFRIRIAIVVNVFFLQIVAGSMFCQIHLNDVIERNQVFTIADGGVGEKLLQTDVVSPKQQLNLMCKPNQTTVVICQSNGKFSPLFDSVQRCEKAIGITTIERNASCAPDAKFISFGYKMNRNFLELYRVCYSRSLLKTYFTAHQTDHYTIVTPRPNVQFTTGGLIPTQATLMYKSERIYNTFNELLGAKQEYIDDGRTTVIARGHLAPSGDFPFIDQMKATFRYANVVPQFHIINLSNWKKIENWVRQKANTVRHRVQVVTGGHDVLELRHSTEDRYVQIHLSLGDEQNQLPKIPVPKWMYKIIKFANDDIYVFVTYNNPYATQLPDPICRIEACPHDINTSSWGDFKRGYTHCCEIGDFKKNVISTVPI